MPLYPPHATTTRLGLVCGVACGGLLWCVCGVLLAWYYCVLLFLSDCVYNIAACLSETAVLYEFPMETTQL